MEKDGHPEAENRNKAIENEQNNSNDNGWLQGSLMMFARFSSWVIGPVLIGALLGKWLESKFNQGGQLIFLICIGTAFIISISGLVIEAGKEYKKIENDAEKKKDRNTKNG